MGWGQVWRASGAAGRRRRSSPRFVGKTEGAADEQPGDEQQAQAAGYLTLPHLGRGFDLLAEPDVQLPHFSSTPEGRRWEALGALGLGKGNDVADRFGAGHHGDDADRGRRPRPPWGGAPYLRASRRKPNLACCSSGPMFSAAKTFSLDVGAVDTDRAAAQFPAVERRVVGLGQAFARIGGRRSRGARPWAGEGVVAGSPALGSAVVFEHGKSMTHSGATGHR